MKKIQTNNCFLVEKNWKPIDYFERIFNTYCTFSCNTMKNLIGYTTRGGILY